MSQTTENDSPRTASTQPETAAEAGNEAGIAAPAEAVLTEKLAAAQKEAAANSERYLRAVADLENYRKRAMREKDEVRQYGTAAMMEDLIPILDNLGLGLAAAQQQTEVKAIVEGVTLVMGQFKTALERHGLKEVNPAGQAFDPNLHECISHQPSSDMAEEHVMQVVRLGYTLNGRLLRPASVVVSSGPEKKREAKS